MTTWIRIRSDVKHGQKKNRLHKVAGPSSIFHSSHPILVALLFSASCYYFISNYFRWLNYCETWFCSIGLELRSTCTARTMRFEKQILRHVVQFCAFMNEAHNDR